MNMNTFKNVNVAILGSMSFSGYQKEPAGCEGYTFVTRNIAALGVVGQFGDVNVKPLSVPASIGSAYIKKLNLRMKM